MDVHQGAARITVNELQRIRSPRKRKDEMVEIMKHSIDERNQFMKRGHFLLFRTPLRLEAWSLAYHNRDTLI